MVAHHVMQKRTRLYRAIAGHEEQPTARTYLRRDLTSEEKRIDRHMAHKGATTPEIAQAINWTLSQHSLLAKLKAINIKPKHTYTNYLHRE